MIGKEACRAVLNLLIIQPRNLPFPNHAEPLVGISARSLQCCGMLNYHRAVIDIHIFRLTFDDRFQVTTEINGLKVRIQLLGRYVAEIPSVIRIVISTNTP